VKRIIQVRIFRGEHLYVGECLDLPVITQAATLDELARNIQEAIALYVEDCRDAGDPVPTEAGKEFVEVEAA